MSTDPRQRIAQEIQKETDGLPGANAMLNLAAANTPQNKYQRRDKNDVVASAGRKASGHLYRIGVLQRAAGSLGDDALADFAKALDAKDGDSAIAGLQSHNRMGPVGDFVRQHRKSPGPMGFLLDPKDQDELDRILEGVASGGHTPVEPKNPSSATEKRGSEKDRGGKGIITPQSPAEAAGAKKPSFRDSSTKLRTAMDDVFKATK